MVLLHSDSLGTVPKGAVLLTDSEALELQWDEINQHVSQLKVWSLRYGAGILGCLSAATGIYLNQHYRARLRLGTFGSFSTYLPIVGLPAIATTVYHKVFIQSQIILNKEPCPVCVQVKASLFQTALGVAYPSALAPIASYAVNEASQPENG